VNALADALTRLASPWAYVVVAVLAALEASAFVGLVIPGELALLTGGYLAYQGRASLAVMMVVAAVGAVVGDSVGYEIGRHFGERLRRSGLGQKVGADRWRRAESYLAERGGRAVFFGRFIGLLRALVPALAGVSRMPYRTFLAWNALGGVLWAPGFVFLGFVAGSSYRRVEHTAGRAGLLLLIAAAIVAAIVVAARWVARHPDEVRAFVGRFLDRPLPSRLRARYRRQLDFVVRRLRPGQALGLALTIQLLILGLLGWAFGAVVQDVVAGDGLFHIDRPVTEYVVSHRTPWLTAAMRVVTVLGSTAVLIPMIVVVGLLAYRRGKGWRPLALLAAAQGGSIVLYDLVKVLVARPRPSIQPLITTVTGYAFPSGHATQAMAVFGALAFLASGWTTRWSAKVAQWTAAVVVTLLVGMSRVYLGVHWPSDVIGGWALGALWLAGLLMTIRAGGAGRPANGRPPPRSRSRRC
jgi:undecaprenyl-diphosphatase